MATKTKKRATAAKAAQPKRKKYKKHFLTQVIARIDFAPVEKLGHKGPPKPFYEAIRSRFPIAETKTLIARSLQIGPGDQKPQEMSQELREWVYHGKVRDKYLSVAQNMLAVEYSTYQTFEILREDFLKGIDALRTTFGDIQATRLGLRYIDNIELNEENPTDWKKYLHPNLLSIFKIATDLKTIARAFQILEINDGETCIRFQFGMPNPDYPAPIRKKTFTMDTDAYCNLLLSRDEVAQYLDRFHSQINRLFESVITDGLREKMGVTHG
jgi:uncharacterized protein (TIGR04255 family)